MICFHRNQEFQYLLRRSRLVQSRTHLPSNEGPPVAEPHPLSALYNLIPPLTRPVRSRPPSGHTLQLTTSHFNIPPRPPLFPAATPEKVDARSWAIYSTDPCSDPTALRVNGSDRDGGNAVWRSGRIYRCVSRGSFLINPWFKADFVTEASATDVAWLFCLG